MLEQAIGVTRIQWDAEGGRLHVTKPTILNIIPKLCIIIYTIIQYASVIITGCYIFKSNYRNSGCTVITEGPNAGTRGNQDTWDAEGGGAIDTEKGLEGMS